MRLVSIAMLLVCVQSLACSRIMGTKAVSEPIPNYAGTPIGLEQLFSDVLKAAQADDRNRVHDLFQSLKMTRAELDGLFGARSGELSPPYEEMMATLIHRGAVEIVAMVYEKKYDAVEVFPFELMPLPHSGDDVEYGPPARADVAALSRNLIRRPPIYTVHLRKKGASGGARYNFLFFSEGHWRTGNQLGALLAKWDELTLSQRPR